MKVRKRTKWGFFPIDCHFSGLETALFWSELYLRDQQMIGWSPGKK